MFALLLLLRTSAKNRPYAATLKMCRNPRGACAIDEASNAPACGEVLPVATVITSHPRPADFRHREHANGDGVEAANSFPTRPQSRKYTSLEGDISSELVESELPYYILIPQPARTLRKDHRRVLQTLSRLIDSVQTAISPRGWTRESCHELERLAGEMLHRRNHNFGTG